MSETLYSKIDEENRYDSEYFQTKFIKAEESLKSKPNFKLSENYKVTDGEHGSVIVQEKGVKYLTAENIKNGYVDITNVRYVDEQVDKRNARARVEVGDILISIKGTLGRAAIAENWLLPANMNRDVAILKPIHKIIPSEYVCLFLLSEFGSLQSVRVGSGGVQQMITLERLRKFIIPLFSDAFYNLIICQYKKSQKIKIESDQLYASSESILIEFLRFKEFDYTSDTANIKRLKKSFLATGRLDAEYYQPKYEDYLNQVYQFKNGYRLLIIACTLKDANFNPKDEQEYQYIEISNIGKTGDISGCLIEKGKELPSRARRKVNTGDVIISSIEGSLESCAIITSEYDNALCSTGFYVINSDLINSETLLVLFKSPLMQNILKQACSGTILTAINKTEFQNIPIPIVEADIQKQISNLVKESFHLKKQAEQLLEVAKKALEMAIEQDEKKATEFINSNLIS